MTAYTRPGHRRQQNWFWLYGAILGVCFMMAVITNRNSPMAPQDVAAAVGMTQAEATSLSLPGSIQAGMPVGIETQPASYTNEKLWAGKMLLIDSAHPVPAEAPAPNTYSVSQRGNGQVATRSAQTVTDMEVIEALSDLFVAARQKGYGNLVVWAGTRSLSQQLDLQLERLTIYAQSYSLVEAAQLAQQDCESPGYSEHQTGYAVDIRLCDGWNLAPRTELLSESEEGRYLLDNCWRYGFIHRYATKNPPRMEEENYHFRYVGKAHAAMIHEMNMTFEEYLDFLHEAGTVCLYSNGELKYVVQCQLVSGDWSLRQPANAKLTEVSMDNTGYAIAIHTF